MQFTCDKELILKEISVANEIIVTRNAISILANVFLEADGDALTIKATDLKVSFETRIPVMVDKPGSTTVLCDKFLSILKTLPGGDVQFVCGEGDKLSIASGPKIDFQLHSISADKFPEIAESAESDFFPVPQRDFIEMINQTVFAVSDDETRYYMNGIYMERAEDRLVMVATDGRRLSYISKVPESDLSDFEGVIIPPKVLNLVRKLASGEGELRISIADKMLFIQFDNQKVTSTLIEGQFPKYERVIPESHDFEITVDGTELLNAVKRVSLLAEKNSKRIFLTVADNTMSLSSEESDIGKAKEELECRFDGPKSTFSLNHVYLTDPLKAIEEDEVMLKFTDTKKAITLVSSPESAFFHVIMPIQKG